MVFVCNLRNTHSLANVVITFAIKTWQSCHYIKPMPRVYTRECDENKNTRFWATYADKAFDVTAPITGSVVFKFLISFA